jgi:hypothetical protein
VYVSIYKDNTVYKEYLIKIHLTLPS